MAYEILIENILKGIVVSNAKNGIRFDQIKGEFLRHAGELYRTGIVKQLKEYLRNINGLYHRSEENGVHERWYAGKPPPVAETNAQPKYNDHVIHRRSSNAMHTRSKENLRSHGSVDQNNNNCSASTKDTSNGKLSAKSNNISFRSSTRSDPVRMNARRPGNRNVNFAKQRYNRGKTVAALYDYDLVGDDFLMSVAKIDLKCTLTEGHVNHCGLCVSGQTIRSAAQRLRGYADMKIILNIGSVDLLHGRDFLDMREDFLHLMEICDQRNIQVIITTLVPLANVLNTEGSRAKWDAFNQFLIQTYSSSHKVIHIHECMIDQRSRKTLFDCYQPEPKYVSGSNRPHLLWNRLGRQRVLKHIKSKIGI